VKEWLVDLGAIPLPLSDDFVCYDGKGRAVVDITEDGDCPEGTCPGNTTLCALCGVACSFFGFYLCAGCERAVLDQ
jgi:hypothetical protein